ncbi:MAG: DUF2442 domain-containing protein [Deltaproteobacteria bacterium]|nr:DUF2442 domain-containing protein [Deltaproteobacteria bacterium]
MKSQNVGKNTSEVEVLNISRHGLWLLLHEEEVFLPFDLFPWFRTASVAAVLNVRMLSSEHLYWPDLDVDLEPSSIRSPGDYPLVSRTIES